MLIQEYRLWELTVRVYSRVQEGREWIRGMVMRGDSGGMAQMELPKDSTLMHPNDYSALTDLRCVYEGQLSGLPQRQKMDLGGEETVVSVYLGLALGLVKAGVRRIF